MNKRNQVLFPPAIVANDKLTVATKRQLCKLQATTAPSSLDPEVQLPPGPKQFPLVGNVPHLLADELPHRALRNLARIHGPVMLLRLGEVNLVVISSREGAEEVLRAQDVNFANRPKLTAAKIIFYDCNDVLFSSYSSYWQQLRRICIMELLSGKRVRSYSALRVDEVTNLVHEVSIAAAHGKPVNLSNRLSALASNIVCRASFGQKCSNPSRFVTLVDEIATLISGFNAGDFFPSLKFLDVITGARSKLERIRREMDRILDESIEAHQSSHNEGEVQDLIDVLLHLKDQGDLEIPITTETIKAIILVCTDV
ncbi:cytochrome P450 mono-oxygenase [Canna indica]|uniref:Cytochrome P450 mono-oxygenase n=1 Tax=Canna indica TaxID=4628 RepID=A0AAQ3K9V8_9LILI|nr:cytochrome P450 mono-oxygenase [Canna indica]